MQHLRAATMRASSPLERQVYCSPQLSLLGDVCSLTESGSMASMEDLIPNGQCDRFFGTLNTTGNMC